MNAIFKNFSKEIVEEIIKAQKEIKIAMSWFTDKEIFFQLIEALLKGVEIELILNDDYVNNRKRGIGLKRFLNCNGKLFFYNSKGLMHNKFAIIDQRIVLSGSNNWTYSANYVNKENLMIISNQKLVDLYIGEYELIKQRSYRVKVIVHKTKAVKRYEQEIIESEKNLKISMRLNY